MPEPADQIRALDLGVRPEAAVSGPLLVQDDQVAILLFNGVTDAGEDVICKVEFVRGATSYFGWPNDEALDTHPLAAKGLEAYGIYEVLNSSWLATIEARNRVAFPGSGPWRLRHFVFTFHDSTFECLSSDLRLTIHKEERPVVVKDVFEQVRLHDW